MDFQQMAQIIYDLAFDVQSKDSAFGSGPYLVTAWQNPIVGCSGQSRKSLRSAC